MRSVASALRRHRTPVAAAGLLLLCGALAWEHAPRDAGLAAEEIEPLSLASALDVDRQDKTRAATGALLLDFVEPADGEGGSEAAIADLVGKLRQSGVAIEPAGFYSEGEHLYRMEGIGAALVALREQYEDHPLLEGIEPELLYAFPDTAIFAEEGPAADEVEPAKNKPDRFLPNDPMFALQWNMERIRAPEAWMLTRGAGALVAVIDSGVAYKTEHGVMQVPDLAGTKFVGGRTFCKGVPDGLDDHAHGTHVAGTIAQTTHNGIGVTGVAHEATVMSLKALTREGRGSVAEIANAIRYAADNGANVINMSLGGSLPSRVLAKAVEYAHDEGVTVVCAAGNEARSRVGYPAANEGCIAVGSVDWEGNRAFYSNWGKNLDVMAPGGDTREDKNGDGYPDGVLQNTIKIQQPAENDYLWFQGTSMASPHAAGVAALVVSAGVTNPDEVESILKQTAVHPKGVDWDKDFGAGVVDAHAAVTAAEGRYAPERAGLGGLLALLGLGGLGVAGLASRRARVIGAAGLVGGLALASGALGTTPLAYGIAATQALDVGSPLLHSAALPLVLAVLLLGVKPLRGFLAGLSLGYAALLLHGAVVLPTLIHGLPGGTTIDRLWLLANAVLGLALARRISRS